MARSHVDQAPGAQGASGRQSAPARIRQGGQGQAEGGVIALGVDLGRGAQRFKGGLQLQGYPVGEPLPPQAPLPPEGVEEVRRALEAIGAL